jgi:hypothetical protein
VELIIAEGVNSMLAQSAKLELRNMILRDSERVTPFNGSLSGNTDFIIANCDLYIWGDTPNSSTVSTARSLTATNSVLRRFRGTATHQVRITNSTLAGFVGVHPVVPHPQQTTFEIENSAVLGFLRAQGELN